MWGRHKAKKFNANSVCLCGRHWNTSGSKRPLFSRCVFCVAAATSHLDTAERRTHKNKNKGCVSVTNKPDHNLTQFGESVVLLNWESERLAMQNVGWRLVDEGPSAQILAGYIMFRKKNRFVEDNFYDLQSFDLIINIKSQTFWNYILWKKQN